MKKYQFIAGILFALIGAALTLIGDGAPLPGIGMPIGILGIGLIATARRKQRAERDRI